MRDGADNFLGEIGGVARWSVGAEVSGEERGRETKIHVASCMLTNSHDCLPELIELAVGEGEMVVNGLLSAKRR